MTDTTEPPAIRSETGMIVDFGGDHWYLSNFSDHTVSLHGWTYKTAEHAFAARKTLEPGWADRIHNAATPGKAKALGRKAPLRRDWERIKVEVMIEVVRAKFTQHDDIAIKLAETSPAILVEGNTWGDHIWGAVPEDQGNTDGLEPTTIWIDDAGRRWLGTNHLGVILMSVRAEVEMEMAGIDPRGDGTDMRGPNHKDVG